MKAHKQDMRSVDQKARVSLPKEFANSTVLVERVGEGEVRIRKAVVVPEGEYVFDEERPRVLSRRDSEIFLNLLTDPPGPNPALKKAAKRYKKRHGLDG
jgi:hypothetical protein